MNKRRHGGKKPRPYLALSYGLLAVAFVSFLLTGIILDSLLASLSLTSQRWLIGLTLVLPAALGSFMGILALRQPNRHTVLTIFGIILNGTVALFFIALLGIAG